MTDTTDQEIGSAEEQLKFIQEANDLRKVNHLLTRVMAQMKVQALIKAENLSLICDAVMDLALMGNDYSPKSRLRRRNN